MASIGDMHGMDPKDATRLRKAGVRTTEALLKAGSSRAGRSRLAAESGLSAKAILGWVHRADLMRIKGIGSEYADLLHSVGVGTISELAKREPTSLVGALVQSNGSKRLVRRLPTEGMVAGWIGQATELGSSISS